ncbi:hypothetical protein LTR85_004222 [Meristemomyces frigidus]|nr:hypothetical protein LTR85_004222 [Meristemomyces frigidus]
MATFDPGSYISGDTGMEVGRSGEQNGEPDAVGGARKAEESAPSPTIQLPQQSPKANGTTEPSNLNDRQVSGGHGSLLREPAGISRPRRPSSASGQRLRTSINNIKAATQAARQLAQGRSNRPRACDNCAQLKLTFESFVIEDGAEAVQVHRPNFYGKRLMGTYNDIQQRSKICELCQLLVKSMDLKPASSGSSTTADGDAKCSLFWRVDGREHVSSASGTRPYIVKRTRRLAIEWESSGAVKQDLSYVVLVAPDGRFLPDGTVNPQGERTGRSTFFLGRKLTSLNVANIQLVQEWLQLCRNNHTDCAPDHNDPKFRDLLNEPSFYIVNVEQMCLEYLPDGERYAALSYTWGPSLEAGKNDDDARDLDSGLGTGEDDSTASGADTPADEEHGTRNSTDTVGAQEPRKSTDPPKGRFVTTSANAPDLEQPDGVRKVLKDMPVAIQNAIALAQHLKFKYIWIDSLCIIQDNKDSWKINARLMDVVYGNADLTICAADGDGADVGLEALYVASDEPNHHSKRPSSDQQVIATDEKDRALLFGLPASHFDLALLWQPQEVSERRQLEDIEFPSWSWSGWKCEKGISYRKAAVAGPAINLHEWLLRRTWITYYIRDANGHLRLVWDPDRLEHSDICQEGRWKGYETRKDGWPRPSKGVEFAVDFHGRPFNHDVPWTGRLHQYARGLQDVQFEKHLHPFRRKNKILRPGSKKPNEPDKPYLQFCTYHGRFYVDVESDEDRFIQTAAIAGQGLKRYAILDRHRDFAGTILLEEAWSKTHSADEPQEFIALSDARDFDESEYGNWNLYTEEAQDAVPWQLYNVLMIVQGDLNQQQEGPHSNVSYRKGLGKIYIEAFGHACANGEGEDSREPAWKEIILG